MTLQLALETRQPKQSDPGMRPAVPQPIAIMIGQLAQGGSERQLYAFLAHCARSRWQPVVYVSGQLGYWEEPIRSLGIEVVLLQGGRISKMRQLRADCLQRNVTCFFSWSSYTNAFALSLMGSGIRRIGSFRNAMFADLPSRFRAVWSWASLAGISVAVCNSRDTCEQLARRPLLRPRAVYVPNVVERPAAETIAQQRREWRARLGIEDEAILVLGVGRLTVQKRFDRFIDVIARVRAEIPAQAVIAGGDFGCREGLEEEIRSLGLQSSVRLIGTVPDARNLMCAADVFLLTSDFEGMPNVVLEAMAAGTPCVATAVNAVPDLIEHGVTGFTAACDAADLARHVCRLARDPALRDRIGRQSRAAVGQGRDPRTLARRLWDLCEAEA